VFKRRQTLKPHTVIWALIWPKGGWGRAGRYLWHRVSRLPGSPNSIAAGLACGAAMSLTPFVGAHFFLAAFLVWLIRGNLLAAAFGTILGNPWTFPVIWLGSYHIGALMLRGENVLPADEVDFTAVFANLVRSTIELDSSLFLTAVWPVLSTMILGSVPCVILSWTLIFFLTRRSIEIYQQKRMARMKLKQSNIALDEYRESGL